MLPTIQVHIIDGQHVNTLSLSLSELFNNKSSMKKEMYIMEHYICKYMLTQRKVDEINVFSENAFMG